MNAPNGQAEFLADQTRRAFFGRAAGGFGALALGCLLREQGVARPARPHFAPRAKRVISLFMSGGPSHVDTFDPKPLLTKLDGQPMPADIIRNHEFAMIKTREPKVKGSPWKFRPHGQSGIEISELFPHVAGVADELAIVRSLYSDTFNHDPAVTFMNTGNVRFGWPSLGAWASYGLGTENSDLPAYIVLASGKNIQPLLDSYWGAGFLPPEHQGVSLRTQGDPVLYLKNPAGVSSKDRRAQLDTLAALNQQQYQEFADPEILARIKQHELAYRMQTSVPELMDLSGESAATFELYGEEARQAGSFAACCLNARRLAERGVRNIQIFHRGWDAHGGLPREHESQCKDIDQGCYALIKDLKQRGMLDETLVVWGGEFGRTSYCQGKLTKDNYGRDHHPRCFTTWMAGGGIKPGITYGQTDDYAYNIADADGNAIKPTKDKWTPGTMHIHDLNATILNQLGIDHRKLTYRYQGRDFRLTDVHGHVIRDLVT